MSAEDALPPGPSEFQPTAWSCLEAARDRQHPEHKQAVDRFVTLYWKPIFCFLRWRVSYHEAKDLTQDFLSRFLEEDLVGKADPAKGRFRSFLLGVVKNWLREEQRHRSTRRRRHERAAVSIEGFLQDADRTYEPQTNETPEEVFNRTCAASVLEHVLDDLREHFVADRCPVCHDLFVAYHFPVGKRPSRQALAEHFGLTLDQVRHRLRLAANRFDRLLRAELRHQGVPEAEIEDEIRELLRLLGRNADPRKD
jgi:RNA polymerase sigma-70 factor (ECF subfamily)